MSVNESSHSSNPIKEENQVHELNIATGKDATKILAKYALNTHYDDLPPHIQMEAARSFVNFMGVTVGSCRHEAIDIAVSSLKPVSASEQATILGRSERFDILNAAFINGVGSHVFDFDDTHLVTNVHASGPIASALLAHAELYPTSGKDFMNAFYLGVELTIRLSNSVAPNHADIGWHVTGTHPTIGAAAAIGRLMQLNEQQMIWALGLAASQPVGFRDSFGSMNKSFNPGRSAANGIFSALLAQNNFTSSNQMIESRIGWAKSISTKCNYDEMLGDLGVRFEIAKNTYKPFACGIVIHPALDGAIQLRNRYQIEPKQIKSIFIKANPNTLELTGKKSPTTGLEGKFSVYHSVAIAMIDGKAGEPQYSEAAVLNQETISLREKIIVEADPRLPKKSGEITIILNDGRVLNQFIESAIGGVENPLNNEQLDTKFLELTQEILPANQSLKLLKNCWEMSTLSDAGSLAKSTVP